MAADPALRPNALVLSETLVAGTDSRATWPLYLTRRGEYYVELMLERPAGGERPKARTFDAELVIRGRGRELLRRRLETELGRDRPVATLAWFTSDREVPIKTGVELELALSEADGPPDRLRIQVRRRPNRPRWY